MFAFWSAVAELSDDPAIGLRLCINERMERPDLRDVARELGASARTLQRRLGELGVTYHDVLEESRRDMASH